MAAAVSNPWKLPQVALPQGSWALEAEEHDAEVAKQAPLPSSAPTQISDSSAFPSLAAAATTKTKKKKPQAISLAEFSTYSAPKQVEIVNLPTGPREKTAEELERPRGFRGFGSGRGSDDSRWGSKGNEEGGERRSGFGRERERESGPSRADEDDNWGAGKKVLAQSGGFERRERERGVVSSGFFESSKADEVDSWVSSKAPLEPRRVGSGGDRFEKRGSFESLSRNRDSSYGNGADSDSWGRRREESVAAPSLSGSSRPKLVLQPRTLPAPVVEVKQESVVRPESPVVVNVERPKGANPFGNARPREEVLAEKGQDWKEIEEKLEAVKLKEVAAVIEKSDERSPGKMGFGLGNGRKDDRTERSWRKSTEQTEEGAQQEEPAVEQANKEEDTKEEAAKEEANTPEAETKN